MLVISTQIENLTDARYFAAYHVDWIIFKHSASGLDGLTMEEIHNIIGWLDGPKYALELSAALEHFDTDALSAFDGIALSPFADVAQMRQNYKATIFQNLVVQDQSESTKTIEANKASVDFFILKGDGIRELDHDVFQALGEKCNAIFPVFKGMSFEGMKESFALKGVHVEGSTEEKVGLKSFEELDELFENWEGSSVA